MLKINNEFNTKNQYTSTCNLLVHRKFSDDSQVQPKCSVESGVIGEIAAAIQTYKSSTELTFVT